MKATLILFTIFLNLLSHAQHGFLYTNQISNDDSLEIFINFYTGRNQIQEKIIVYSDSLNKYYALLTNDSMINRPIKLSAPKIDQIKKFEKAVYEQQIKSNLPIFIYDSSAEYKVMFRKGYIFYTTTKEYFSLIKALTE